jgi:AcrR family transcriptional regulator
VGRKRVISEDMILDAAQYVVARDGAAQLTIDAVANQAGISKASVLYLYKSKRALIEAIVHRAARYDSDFNEAAIESLGSVDGGVVRGRILAATEFLPEASRSIALDICAAVAQDAQLRKPMQEFQNSIIGRIARTSAHPRGALLAHLALEGLKLLELLDFHSWSKAERNHLLREIEWLVDVDPKPLNPSGKMKLPSALAKHPALTGSQKLKAISSAAHAKRERSTRKRDSTEAGPK